MRVLVREAGFRLLAVDSIAQGPERDFADAGLDLLAYRLELQ
jgi:hypothetical protein